MGDENNNNDEDDENNFEMDIDNNGEYEEE